LHSDRRLPCSHIWLPPHSLHRDRCLPCSHISLPPHSLHFDRRLPCSHIWLPRHSLHSDRCLPCLHTLLVFCFFGAGHTVLSPSATSDLLWSEAIHTSASSPWWFGRSFLFPFAIVRFAAADVSLIKARASCIYTSIHTNLNPATTKQRICMSFMSVFRDANLKPFEVLFVAIVKHHVP
jgi:hypothetical protein